MATKMSNNNLYNIVLKAKKYHTPDVYIALVHLSTQIKDNNKNEHFIIQTGSVKTSALVRTIVNFTGINRQTVVNCINEIQDLGLLSYNNDIVAWELPDMIDSMLKEGYTTLNKVLLGDFFKTLKLKEKKLLLYMVHLLGTKKNNMFTATNNTDFVANINNHDSMWKKIVTTSNSRTAAYYAKYTLEKFINKLKAANIIIDLTDKKRYEDFRPKQYTQFIFVFNAPNLKETKKELEERESELLEVKYSHELDMIRTYAKNTGVTLNKQKIYQFAHCISSLTSWKLKEFVTRVIIKKYMAIQIHKTREDIKSLPAYIAAIIKDTITKTVNNIDDIEVKTNIKTLAI